MSTFVRLDKKLLVWGEPLPPDPAGLFEARATQLSGLNPADATERELKDALEAIGRGYVTRPFYAFPRTSFRARGPVVDPLRPWTKVSEIWIPPAKDLAQGRFNRAGKPVLYASSDPFTALAEVRALASSFYVLLVMRFKGGSNLAFSQVGFEKLPNNDLFKKTLTSAFGGVRADPDIAAYVAAAGITERWQMQDQMLSEVATRRVSEDNKDHYRITNLLAERLTSFAGLQGFTYPSVETDFLGINWVMARNPARRFFTPLEAWLVETSHDPIFVPQIVTSNREPVVVRRGVCTKSGAIDWGDEGRWPLHALHKQIAPRSDR